MRLPPLPTLRFFEAVARHLSVKSAAAELHVTSGAVSQQIRKLEEFLGRSLFERLPRGLQLTAAGVAYFDACRQALAVIGHATAQLTEAAHRPIVVSCTPSFAAQWLVPRLQGFLQAEPEADVHVSSTNRLVEPSQDGVHFAIRHGLGRYPGLQAETLVDDDLIPVCSPRLLAPRRTARIEDIASARLLHDEHRGDWRLWIEAAGLQGVDAAGGVVFVDSNAAIEAACAGQGFALVRQALVQAELRSRRLVAVKGPALRTPLAYRLVYRSEALIDPALRRFRDWLIDQSGDQRD